MALVNISYKGSFSKTFRFLRKAKVINNYIIKKLDKYGKEGVDALRNATPKRTGLTSESWSYEVISTENGIKIIWSNSNNNHGVYIAVLLQYGHGTRNGGYVQGIDYINPAMKPIFESIADRAWAEVISDG